MTSEIRRPVVYQIVSITRGLVLSTQPRAYTGGLWVETCWQFLWLFRKWNDLLEESTRSASLNWRRLWPVSFPETRPVKHQPVAPVPNRPSRQWGVAYL